MPMNHGVNEKTLPSASNHLSPFMLYRTFFCSYQIIAKDNASSD